MKPLLLFLVTAFTCTVLHAQDTELFKGLHALEGTWKMETAKGPLFEEWRVLGKISLLGRSYKLKGTDTLLLESVTLTNKREGIYYIPTVTGQNNGRAVSFKMISNDHSSFTFENKEHDFPQRVIYKIINADSLVARIEGSKGGKQMSSNFSYSRIK
jgi:hypothetical protein